MPVHVWAMLVRGREAESVEILQSRFKNGLHFRERWREYDGEQRWKLGIFDKGPMPRRRKEWWVRRMVWEKRDGVWRGEWEWREHERWKEWALWHRGAYPSLIATQAPWHDVPQEVLLNMALYAKVVGAHRRFMLL